jgi:ribosomal protein S18 acetylase RimI-like enzyme
VRLTKLLPEDEPAIRRWTEDFLVDHLRWWSDATGLGWDDAAIARHIATHGLAAKDAARLNEAASKWQSNLVVVARDEAPVGAIWAESRVDPFLAFQVGVIAWIYVDPEARGKGVGGVLVEAAKEWMRAMEIDLVQLSVVGANAAAVRMYEKAGLRAVDLRMFGPTR